MTATAVQRFYRYHAYVYDFTRWTILRGRGQAVEQLKLRPDAQVLEVGCGTGLNFSQLLARLDPRRGWLTGLDFSEDMLARARRRVAAHGWSNVSLVCADAARMDLGRRFDGILFAYSLTMIPDWLAALERARTHLEPGGRMVVLDFGRFERWGPLGALARGWLRLNHVETRRPYVETMGSLFDRVEVHGRLGGYWFTAVGSNT